MKPQTFFLNKTFSSYFCFLSFGSCLLYDKSQLRDAYTGVPLAYLVATLVLLILGIKILKKKQPENHPEEAIQIQRKPTEITEENTQI